MFWSEPARAQYAAGTGANAAGAGATAIGKNAQAIGPYSFAQGFNASAGSAHAAVGRGGGIAIGTDSIAGSASGGSNIAIGSQAVATSPDTTGDNIAFGSDAKATGRDSMAIGGQTTASGTNSIAIGNNFTSSASNDSIVIGVGSRATNTAAGSVVLGNNARSGAAGGVALGFESVALRGALNGTEAFSGATVAGTLGAVSVGNAADLRQVTNLAGGTQDTDAVNLRQLRGAGNALAGALGGGATFSADGTLTAPKYAVQGQVLNTVGGAISNLDAAITTLNTSGSRYFAVKTTGPAAQALGTDSVAMGAGATALTLRGVALGTGSVADRAGLSGATEAFFGTSVASTAGAVSVGAVGSERQITNVAGGTTDTDAVNLRQLRSVGGNLASALGGGAAFGADGSFTGPSYTVGGRTYGNVGGAITALDTTGVKYDIDASTGGQANSISLAGGDPNQPVLLRNVAAGAAATDAANLGQVVAQVAKARGESFAYTDQQVAAGYGQSVRYTDQRVAALDQRVDGVDQHVGQLDQRVGGLDQRVGRLDQRVGTLEQRISGLGNAVSGLAREVGNAKVEARRAAAVGLAAASLRFDDRPGKLSLAAGGGLWHGESAGAFGLGYTLPDGSGRLNATGATTGRDFRFGAGASFTLN
ncbi:MAG TPA: YadA-like family protein [Methylobacterium sp.]|nr:YadA-like family protein [Methylobacterium sp.]